MIVRRFSALYGSISLPYPAPCKQTFSSLKSVVDLSGQFQQLISLSHQPFKSRFMTDLKLKLFSKLRVRAANLQICRLVKLPNLTMQARYNEHRSNVSSQGLSCLSRGLCNPLRPFPLKSQRFLSFYVCSKLALGS